MLEVAKGSGRGVGLFLLLWWMVEAEAECSRGGRYRGFEPAVWINGMTIGQLLSGEGERGCTKQQMNKASDRSKSEIKRIVL